MILIDKIVGDYDTNLSSTTSCYKDSRNYLPKIFQETYNFSGISNFIYDDSESPRYIIII